MTALDAVQPQRGQRFDETAYLGFLDAQTEDGRWELIEGIPIQMPPATIRHLRIATNLEQMLNAVLSAGGSPFAARREAPLRHLDREFRPVADVAVIDARQEAEIGDDRFYDRCLMIAEVLSPSTEHYDLIWKLPRYRELADCHHVLMLSQHEQRARLWSKSRAWQERIFDSQNIVEMPEFGFSCRLIDLYRGTSIP